MLQLLLVFCAALPIAWLVSEAQRRRWISVVLGIAAQVAVGFLAYAYGSIMTGIDRNLYFGDANEALFDALSDAMQHGETDRVQFEFGFFAKNYHSSYENNPPFDEQVERFTDRLNEVAASRPKSATYSKGVLVAKGEQVTVSGTYSAHGKFGPYIRLGESEVYLVANQSASWPDFDGKRVTVSGNLRLEPAGVSTSDTTAVPPARLLLTTTPESIHISEEE